MKTIQVEDFTWKTLQEMKLEKNLPTINSVIEQLIITSYAQTVETKKHICSSCGQEFSSYKILETHLRDQHLPIC
jgi:DNA-directed RNA polymerase subunit M/transcription elongation factor TFIIS